MIDREPREVILSSGGRRAIPLPPGLTPRRGTGLRRLDSLDGVIARPLVTSVAERQAMARRRGWFSVRHHDRPCDAARPRHLSYRALGIVSDHADGRQARPRLLGALHRLIEVSMWLDHR